MDIRARIEAHIAKGEKDEAIMLALLVCDACEDLLDVIGELEAEFREANGDDTTILTREETEIVEMVNALFGEEDKPRPTLTLIQGGKQNEL